MATPRNAPRRGPYRPLAGIRVLSFELAYSLPAATRMLSELGAEVVRVAPPRGVGFADFTTAVDGVSLGKANIAINLKTDEGKQLARALVARADIVSSNFTAPVMPSFGLGPADLRALKPDLIVLRLSGYGSPGPWTTFPAFAAATEAVAGLNSVQGNDGDPPVRVGSGIFADQLSGMYAVLAIVAALERRAETGEGADIDLAMAECVTLMLGPQVMETSRTGSLPARTGNRAPNVAPQGVYPCQGDDEWLALTVASDVEWTTLVELIDDDRLRAPELRTRAERVLSHDAIDAVIAEWTRPRHKLQLAECLQARGIAAGPVQNAADRCERDTQLKERGYFIPLPQSEIGTWPVENFPARFQNTPISVGGPPGRAAPLIGEDNDYVYREVLGLKAEEITALREDWVI